MNYRLHTSLHLAPTAFRKNQENYSLVKGATAEFSVNFDDYPYLKPAEGEPWYKYLEQMTFIFKHENDVRKYKLFDGIEKKEDLGPDADPTGYIANKEHYYFMLNENRDLNYIEIDLILNSIDTKTWDLTENDDSYAFEIVMNVDTYLNDEIDNDILKSDSIIIEPQMPVITLDSLYNEVGD